MLARSGEITAPCPEPPVTDVHDPVFQHARREPFADEADDARVADPMLDETDEPVLVHRIEERLDVGVQYDVHLPVLDGDHKRIHGVVGAATRPEPVREPEEVLLVDRVQHRDNRTLDNLVLQCGNRERTLSTVRLGYVCPPGRLRPVRPPMDPCMQLLESALEVCFVVPIRQPVDPGRSIPLELAECLPEQINTDVVEERGEPFLLPFPCCLPYALQSL